jgi:hypothetical protein
VFLFNLTSNKKVGGKKVSVSHSAVALLSTTMQNNNTHLYASMRSVSVNKTITADKLM